MPFYKKHLVDTFVPGKGMKKDTAEKVKGIRMALARYLATAKDEFPTGSECAEAERLWRSKCRDAAVAIVRFRGMHSDARYWQGAKMFSQAISAHDFEREPVLGYILRSYLCKAERIRLERRKSNPAKPFRDACVSLEKHAIADVIDIFKNADPGILERLDSLTEVPKSFAEKVGNAYLSRCIVAENAMEAAFDARGSGWARDVTEEGWKGFADNNDIASSNLLAAVRLRPSGARAAMMLSRLS